MSTGIATAVPPDPHDDLLTVPAKAVRTVALVLLATTFLGGTTLGNDHWWPFSPWRMYSTSTAPTGSVASTLIQVRTTNDPATWAPAPLTPETVGLNRAEVEGRLDAIVEQPTMLASLAKSHRRLRPDQPGWLGVRVVVRHFHLLDGALTGRHHDQEVARWEAP